MINNTIPSLGLGTYGRTGKEGVDAMLAALEIGYRHLDTAQSYGTEVTVGEAVARSGLKRRDLLITTKVADTQLAKADFLPSVEKSLETLRLDQVDLLLIHWPVKKDLVPFEDYMLALAEAKDRGFARLIGVSNFPIALLDRSRDLIGENALTTNQVEIHPYLQSPKIVGYARSVGLQLTAYMPLAKGRVLDDPAILHIAERHGVTTSAVVLAFLIGEGHIVIPSSASPQRLKDNRAALAVRLDETDIAQLRRLDRGERMINPEKSPVWDD
ncbi:aldo/keto reductase [Agrobacterium rosae]|uniref:Aldo/keto reductase n=1 Tax=Agrobacterium rosae TaxID=1972867 RepID=A0AAW9FFR3_9HYPH|nr:aldo/keto reductase [Agrobacterium rosae]MDX8305447.1 aldo/keto reductase [Agrobacterium rosae]